MRPFCQRRIDFERLNLSSSILAQGKLTGFSLGQWTCCRNAGLCLSLILSGLRTAQEIRSPGILVAQLTEDQNETVALVYWIDKDALPLEVDKTAHAAGTDLKIEANFDLERKYLLLVSARPAGHEVEAAETRMRF